MTYVTGHHDPAVHGNYDETGVSTNGRFLVHFIGEFKQQMRLGRAEVNIELEELA